MELSEPPLAEKTTLLDADGKRIAQFYDQYREIVDIGQVAPIMRTAIVAIEDDRFYQHGAIDLEGTIRALAANLNAGGVAQGGSSITQQYVKQVLLNSATTDEAKAAALAPSYVRKLNELRYALSVEEKYSKDQILGKYLNIAYFGAGAHGIQAAAKRFFGVSASKLNLVQSATLAAAVRLPTSTDPEGGKTNRDALTARRNVVLDRMAELGKITPAEAAKAKKSKLGYKGVPIPGGCETSDYRYFCQYVSAEILADKNFGKTRADRERALKQGGMTIRTTLNPKMQEAAQKGIEAYVGQKDGPVAAQALVEPGTGAIRAMAASRNNLDYNVVADRAHGGLGRGPGRVDVQDVHPAHRAEPGHAAERRLQRRRLLHRAVALDVHRLRRQRGGRPSHAVTNDEGSPGFTTLQTGTWGSVNTFFMELEAKVGLCETVKTAKSLGIKRADGKKLQEFETFTLGINEMDPVTVATAYAAHRRAREVLPADGGHRDHRPERQEDGVRAEVPGRDRPRGDRRGGRHPVRRLHQGHDVERRRHRPSGGRQDRHQRQPVERLVRRVHPRPGRARSAWPTRAARAPTGCNNVTIGGRWYGSVFGATVPGPIWKATMMAALEGVPATPFTPINQERFGAVQAVRGLLGRPALGRVRRGPAGRLRPRAGRPRRDLGRPGRERPGRRGTTRVARTGAARTGGPGQDVNPWDGRGQ